MDHQTQIKRNNVHINTETNPQKDPPDDESDVSFATVGGKDTGFTSKRNIKTECDEPTNKKQKSDKDNCFDMELMIKQLTTVVRECLMS